MPVPDCPGCDECCVGCKDCTDCTGSGDCSMLAVITPDQLPNSTDWGAFGRCCEFQTFLGVDDCDGVMIAACCGGLWGCDSKFSKIIKFKACNKTNRCIEVFTNFVVSGLKGSTGDPDCPDNDADCCILEYAAQFAPPDCNAISTILRPNGIAPGPGFCMPPCSFQEQCFAFRVIAPDDQCGCKDYGEVDRKGCCEIEAEIDELCYFICCSDQNGDSAGGGIDGCSSNCTTVINLFFMEDCPNCCECCKPDKGEIEAFGDFSIVDQSPLVPSDPDCCENMLIEFSSDFYDCCELAPPCETFSSSDSAFVGFGEVTGDSGCTALVPEFIGFDCPGSDCECFFEPVPPDHPFFQDPCICSPGFGVGCGGFGFDDDCEVRDGVVYSGIEECDCPYTTEEGAPTEECIPDPCFLFTADAPCPH